MADKRILWLSDYRTDCKTGYATAAKNIKRQIKLHFGDDIKIDIIAINHFGEDYVESDKTEVVSAKINDAKKDDFGRHIFLKTLSDLDYDGVFIMQDLGVVIPIIPIMEKIRKQKKANGRKQFRSIFYFPVDCRIYAELTKNIEFFDLLVTYTEFGRNQVLKFKPDLKPKLKVVNHGTNTKDYYPMAEDEKLKLKKEFFGDKNDRFIVTNINRNQPRKDIPNTIFGYIHALSIWDNNRLNDWKKPYLYLHCHPKDPLGHDLHTILSQTDLAEGEDYMLLPKRMEDKMATIQELNGIYNASDLFLTTTLGEGWGLTVTEAMACKLPVICPNSTSLTEISDNGVRAYLLNTIVPFCASTDNIIREQTDYVEVGEIIIYAAKKIQKSDDSHREMVERAYKYAAELNWGNVSKKWIEYFKTIY